jgi:hypothetical protein
VAGTVVVVVAGTVVVVAGTVVVVPPPLANEIVCRLLKLPLDDTAVMKHWTTAQSTVPPAGSFWLTNVRVTVTVWVKLPEESAEKVPRVGELAPVPLGRSAVSVMKPETPVPLFENPAPITLTEAESGRFCPSLGVTSTVTPGWSPLCGVARAAPTKPTEKTMPRARAARWRRSSRFTTLSRDEECEEPA